MPKVPNKPTASPESSTFEFSAILTLSVEGEGDLYYRLDEYYSSPEFRYTGPTTLKIEDSEYANIYVYAFARVVVDGINYDSEDAEYIYYPSDITPPPLPATTCPVTYDPALDNDSTDHSIKLNLRDKDGDVMFEDYIYCGYDNDGHLFIDAPYIDKQLNGLEKYYYDSSQLREETPYIDGIMHGTQKRYYESDRLRGETPYVGGDKHGIEKGYQARHATSRNSGTPVAIIRSPTQRMGDALNALRPQRLRTKAASSLLPHWLNGYSECNSCSSRVLLAHVESANCPVAYQGLKITTSLSSVSMIFSV
ncbi:hypothetical protein BJAS_P1113 [Bathymodiolus japonicus methanotrophic gill symbiont]|nr:hypothetical protein BJAS_P1113 [Bathymodiolus japonicus methanotrophic gill symbiont]